MKESVTGDDRPSAPGRLPLYLGLAGSWIFLAFHRELLFHAFRERFDERNLFLIFANQTGFTHALLFCISAATVFCSRGRPAWPIVAAIGLGVTGMTIALARVGYPFNLPDTFQSMAIRSVVYLVATYFGVKLFLPLPSVRPPPKPYTIADALLMTLVAAVFMAAIRGDLGYFHRVTMIDLMYIRNDIAAIVLLTMEAAVEASIGLIWIVLLQRRLRGVAVSLPAVFCAAIVGSVISTMSYKLYRLYQFSEPTQIRSIQDIFQVYLPTLLAFVFWLCLAGFALRHFGVFFEREARPLQNQNSG
jgi:hypothetical protein